MLNQMSTEHLLNIRKIIDEMAMHAALLAGGAEALRMLYPDLLNDRSTQEMYNAARALQAGHLPLSISLAEQSKLIGAEMEHRKIGLSREPKEKD